MTMGTRVHPSDFPAVSSLILDIQALESRAHRLKMHKAAHALNEAKNAAGWELAEQTEAAVGEQTKVDMKKPPGG